MKTNKSGSRAQIIAGVGMIVFLSGSACMKHLDPRPDWKRFDEERAQSTKSNELLAEGGTLPRKLGEDTSGAPKKARSADEIFSTFCSSCHGAAGHGDGAAAAALNPKPRNFSDAKWQASVDDARIAKVIREGGGSVGLSVSMAPWGSVLMDEEIDSLVVKIRKIK